MAKFNPNETTTLRVKVGTLWLQLQTKSAIYLILVALIVALVWIGMTIQAFMLDTRAYIAAGNASNRAIERAVRDMTCHLTHPDPEQRKSACGLMERMP